VEAWIERCLKSIQNQRYPFFNVVMVDDASTDRTGAIMDRFDNGTSVLHNLVNVKMPRNLCCLREGNPDHVIVIVDGDDYLPHEHVLDIIAWRYEDPDLWLMYGSYTRYPDPTLMPNPALPYPADVIAGRSFRQYSADALLYNHPLTFRRRLLQNIEDWELQDDQGVWFETCYDHAIMMPMLEMAAPDHFKWNPEVLYVYNEENPHSEAKQTRDIAVRTHNIINARPKRDQL
jgi:glycosyltransferase involved in cell wall biosynthesis